MILFCSTGDENDEAVNDNYGCRNSQNVCLQRCGNVQMEKIRDRSAQSASGTIVKSEMMQRTDGKYARNIRIDERQKDQ
jgi:hypothetical protein